MSAVIEIPVQTQPLTGTFNSENLKLRQITVKEYDQMIEVGVFDESDRIVLLNGAIIDINT